MHPSLTLQRKRFKEYLRSQKDIAVGVIVTDPVTGDMEYWTPGSIPAGTSQIKRFIFSSALVWTVEHNFGERPLVTVWKGSGISTHGFGTQPFGTSPFGGGTFTEDGEEATDEPLIEEVDLNSFTVTWLVATSGVVVVTSSGGTEISSSWSSITGKPTAFTPEAHALSHAPAGADSLSAYYTEVGHNHDLEYATAGHHHDLDYSALGHDHDLNYSALGHDHDASYLNKTNTDAFTPSADYHPATKKYVDDNSGGGSAAGVSTIRKSGEATGLDGDVNIAAGSGISLAQNDGAKTLTISATGGGGGGTDEGLVKKFVALGM